MRPRLEIRDDELDTDDHEIAEEIERQERMIEVGDEFKFGKRTAKICDEIDFEFTKNKSGGLEVKASGYHTIPCEETQECDMGHLHPVVRQQTFVYRTVQLSKKQKLAFAKWLVTK
jgi:hypothetical protein